MVVSSDYPYGVIDFAGDLSYNVSEDLGLVTLKVVRSKGHTGRLLVTINVGSFGATEGLDFRVFPKGWFSVLFLCTIGYNDSSLPNF